MAWKVTVDDGSMLIDDLSPAELEKIAARNSTPEQSLNWLQLSVTPAMSPTAFYDIVAHVARETGQSIPDRPRTIKEARAFLKHVTAVEDDLPNEFDEQALPLEGADASPTAS